MTIDTSQWNKIAFGDIARCLTVAAKVPLSEGLDRCVGLEHIEPGNIHIKTWGNVADGTTFTRVFRKGQVLFGKRRAYQKKAALAEFDGVCSGDILVCEAIDDAMFPELLPFIVQSDRFFDYAIKTSAGSLSPRTKFKDLAKFSFKLPTTRGEQKRIADLLWSIDEVIERKISLRKAVGNFYLAYLEEVYSSGKKGRKCKIQDICKVNINNLSANTDPNYRFQYLDIAGILGPNTIGNLKEYTFCNAPSRARRVVSRNSLVLSLVRPYFQSFVIVEDNFKDLIASTGTAVLDVLDGVDYRYVFHSFFAKQFLSLCEQRMNGTNYPAINPNDVKSYELSLPRIEEQRILGRNLTFVKANESTLTKEIEGLNTIKTAVINQTLG